MYVNKKKPSFYKANYFICKIALIVKKISIYILLYSLFTGCGDGNDYIQEVYVNIQIPLSQPEYSDLEPIGSSIFVTGGVKGIIIYHAGVNEYKAFDRNCSYEPSSTCAQIDSINSTIASCKCCSSKFLIDQDGIAANGPALLPLKKYYTTLSSSGTLSIVN